MKKISVSIQNPDSGVEDIHKLEELDSMGEIRNITIYGEEEGRYDKKI